jgi:hypothetical protein
MMDPNKAEVVAGIVGAGTFLASLILVGWPMGICLAITALLYLGLNLVLGGRVQHQIQQMMGGAAATLAQLREQIDAHQRELEEIKRWAPSVPAVAIRQRVFNVCDLADKIFRNFSEDPDDIRRAHRFLSQFKKLLPIVRDYVHLASDTDRRQVLTPGDEQDIADTLDAFENNLRDIYQGFQENNLQKLRMATGTLKRMMEMSRPAHGSKGEHR